MRDRSLLRLSLGCVALAQAAAFSAGLSMAAANTAAFPTYALGYEFTESLSTVSDSYPLPVPDPNATAENPLPWRFEVLWAEVEKEKESYDWTVVEKLVDRFRAKGHEPILCLWGGNPLYAQEILSPPTAQDEPYLKAWEAFARSAARRFRGKVRYYEVWRTPNVPGLWPGADAAREYAFLLKRTATVIRAEAGQDATLVSGGLFGGDAAFLQKMFDEGIAPYIDIVALRPDPQQDLEAQVRSIAAVVAVASPSRKIWAMGLTVAQAPQAPAEQVIGEMTRRTLGAFAAGAKLVSFALPRGAQGWPDRVDAIVRLHSVFSPGMGLLPESRGRFEDPQGAPLLGVRSFTFYDPDKGVAAVGYFDAGPQPGPQQAVVTLEARRPGPPLLYDPASGSQTQPEFSAAEKGAKGTVALRSSPFFLLYREGVGKPLPESVEKGPENVEVVARRGMTAEEVITKHQEVAAKEQARLQNYRAKGLVQFHFSLAGASQRLDVAMGGNFFFDPSVGPEWEFTDYFINGNRSPWKKFPELPLVQPEKVVTLPLDISFDRSYSYDMVGEDTVDDKDCWVLSFEPVNPEKSLYRGKVWIDKKSFNKVRTAVTQTRLETPFISNEERDGYGPVGEAGEELWLLKRIDGQQIYTTAGRNFIVLREVTFEGFTVNDTGFQQERQSAYASEHQMLRETDKGFRYLVKDESGERKVKTGIDKSELFGLAGVFYDNSRSYPLPLAGVNYFDYDFRDSGLQTNIFFAGLLLTANATKPNLAGSGFDLGADLFGVAVAGTDRGFDRNGERAKAIDVATKTQRLTFNFGHAVGDFAKVRTSVGFARMNFGRTDDTSKEFVHPANIWERSVDLIGNFDRAGYSLSGSISQVARSDWPFWGCRSGLCGRKAPEQDWNPDAQKYTQYQISGSKEWYLPLFQKIRGELNWFGGTDLDRFSRYQFGFFGGARLRGFSGSGVRFDEGFVGRGIYSFNLGKVVRFDATLDHAHVRDKSSGTGFGDHTGFGISGNFLGPGRTIIQFDVGYALQSDIRKVEGDAEALLVVLKLF